MKARARKAKGDDSSRGHVRRKSITATLAGALASTRACQRVIVRALGRDGVDFVRTLRHCVELHANSSSLAKRFKSDVFKFLAQWIVYEREGRFTAGQLHGLQKPAMRVTLLIVVALHQSLKLDSKRKAGVLTSRVCKDDPRAPTSSRVRATRAKLEWMRHRITRVDSTLQQLSLGNQSNSEDGTRDKNGVGTKKDSQEDGLENVAGGKPDLVDPVDEILKMEDILEALASSLTSIRSDTSLWSELLAEDPPTPKSLGDTIRLFGLAFHALLSPMLENSDSNRLREMVDFASSPAFLSDILTKDHYAQHREVLYRNLTQKGTSFGINTVTASPHTPHSGGAPNSTYIGSRGGFSKNSRSATSTSTDIERAVLESSKNGLFGKRTSLESLDEMSELSSDSSGSSNRSSASFCRDVDSNTAHLPPLRGSL